MISLSGCAAGVSETQVNVSFDKPLHIPPLAASRIDANGTRVFQISAQEGQTSFVEGTHTATWGYNGSYLGPTLRAKRGEQVTVEVTNHLTEPTTVHWHGMHLPAAMDGGPHQEIEPGGTWQPTWKIDQPGATLWYHPHPHGRTEKHVYRGLAGMFIIDDADTAAAGLPTRYGIDDIPVIVQDKRFGPDGQLTLDSSGNEVGTLGSTIMVNGTIGAVQRVITEKVRLRLLNASTARTYNFGFNDDRNFQLVATDGGLVGAPIQQHRIRLSPGERAEIVVQMSPRTQTMLRSYPPDLGRVAAPAAFGGNDSFDVLQLSADAQLAPSRPVSKTLANFGLKEADARVTRSFELADREINGASMSMDRIDETVTLGSTEIWQVRSRNPYPHNFHIHDVQFQILTIDGTAPPPELTGRKDTVYLEPQRTYRLIMKFEDYADPSAPYLYHCHLLLHEDEGLMGQFVVIKGGAQTHLPSTQLHHHMPASSRVRDGEQGRWWPRARAAHAPDGMFTHPGQR